MQSNEDWWAKAALAQTLMQAHEALSRARPNPATQDLRLWRDYYLRSAAIYTEVAQIDRGHFHEATAWATCERQRGEALDRQIKADAGAASSAGEAS
ncbi:AMED_5909 family protein [Lentzea sp. CC55]|uniref:AMED_5909 family protein n=1 Tax=Lentzea sp. CC55 TaxID=2884909 RepID=UPI0027DFCB1E|nr:AMED_5909 family protein [Lentzea sp. CC55]MCG8924154.1 hypothetical protein [Lentzea sp. CC55]